MNHLQKPDRDTDDLVMRTTTGKKNSPKIPKKWFVFGAILRTKLVRNGAIRAKFVEIRV